jgi:ATP synthase protein I
MSTASVLSLALAVIAMVRPNMNDQASPQRPSGQGEELVWTVMSTVLAGPIVYGLIGYAVDQIFDVGVGLPIGIVIGFVLSFYIVYVRYFRN